VIPTPYRWAALAAALVACYGIGHTQAKHAADIERAKVQAVADATNARYRQLETEVANAQAGYVQSWTAARDAARADWLRLKATSRGRMPTVCAESGSNSADSGHGMEAAGTAGDRDLLPALVDALERGEEIERTLLLCQSELRQCAGLR
jgi:Tfp pilus tip-associated adhesin PilY1